MTTPLDLLLDSLTLPLASIVVAISRQVNHNDAILVDVRDVGGKDKMDPRLTYQTRASSKASSSFRGRKTRPSCRKASCKNLLVATRFSSFIEIAL
jgi:hypothetical protein